MFYNCFSSLGECFTHFAFRVSELQYVSHTFGETSIFWIFSNPALCRLRAYEGLEHGQEGRARERVGELGHQREQERPRHAGVRGLKKLLRLNVLLDPEAVRVPPTAARNRPEELLCRASLLKPLVRKCSSQNAENNRKIGSLINS